MKSPFYTHFGEADEGENGQPVAGPSDWWRRLGYGGSVQKDGDDEYTTSDAGLRSAVPDMSLEREEDQDFRLARTRRRPEHQYALAERQATTTSPSSSALPTSYSTAPLFVPPTSTFSFIPLAPSGNITASATTGSSTSGTESASSSVFTTSSPSSRYRSSATYASENSFTSLWSTTRPTGTASPAASPTFVSGKTFNLTLAGTRDDEAIYAVQVELGHGSVSEALSNNYVAVGETEEDGEYVDGEGRRVRRQVADTGPGFQSVRLQVDLGSSDMWVAVTNCTTSDCRSAPAKFDASTSISSGLRANMTYHSGSVSGMVMWEEVQVDKFSIAYQAFIAADRVTNENLGGGAFSGVLGMALPANSIISSQIPGTTSSNPDGATFLDNLFGSGALAPTQRIFSLALERREDVRTTSLLTIGSTYDRYCPSPCSPSYISIIANPNLGVTGYLHWRVPLQGITATTYTDAQYGSGPSLKTITLGGSQVITSRSQPIAVMDSGGVAILVGHKPYADAIYAAYGISASSDGYYRMPCKTPLAFSFNFGGQWFPAHPLDMSWPDPSDPSQTTCIGAIQYANIGNDAGDFIFGSSFLKNVYSIFSYPDQSRASGTWQPGVGLVSLTNATVASQDFYAVRTMRQSLAQVSSQGPFIGGGTSSTSPSSTPSSATGGGSVVNTTAIVAGSVVGFFVLAAVAFSAWFFILKRKYGNNGYPLGRRNVVGGAGNNNGRDTPESQPTSSSTMRTKKHQEAHRQKSMIEGYSDYEGDSWTEGGDSLRLGYMPELLEEEGMEQMRGKRMGSVGSSVMTGGGGGAGWGSGSGLNEKSGDLIDSPKAEPGILSPFQDADHSNNTKPEKPLAAPIIPISGRSRSSSRPRITEPPRPDISNFTYPPNTSSPTSPGFTPLMPYAQPMALPSEPPRSRHKDPKRSGSGSLSMSGPFPSAGARQGLGSIDTSPMYEIRSADYFDVGDNNGRGRRGSIMDSGGDRRDGSGSGSREREGR